MKDHSLTILAFQITGVSEVRRVERSGTNPHSAGNRDKHTNWAPQESGRRIQGGNTLNVGLDADSYYLHPSKSSCGKFRLSHLFVVTSY
jgi:hypothetical protein